jgi:HPt (histidine-containing phosphotransfer) domain-containing protein
MVHDPVIDIAEALERAMGDKQFLKMLMDEFAKSIPEFMKRLKAAQQSGEWAALGQDAHQLKGAAASLGAKAIAAAALQLEQIGKSGQPEGCGQALDRLGRAVEDFRIQLDRIDWAILGTA